ncbi:hypothetical protein [Rahnella laticis]|uniref:hypothetical protein n=1 Tax=Rahnella laticis TaxID=2787622 RepID=UPI0018A25770|nr:hypothetical protein [Rahnella laticis]MBF7993765.1 hypothetical protein [Rahnella laticis]
MTELTEIRRLAAVFSALSIGARFQKRKSHCIKKSCDELRLYYQSVRDVFVTQRDGDKPINQECFYPADFCDGALAASFLSSELSSKPPGFAGYLPLAGEKP